MELTKKAVEAVIEEYFKLHNYSRFTLKGRLSIIENFSLFLKQEKKITDFKDVKEDMYYEYLEYIEKEKGLKKNTLKCYGICLKRIFGILEEEEKILINPFLTVKTVKTKQSIRDKVLTEDEIKLLFSIPKLTTVLGFRNRVILEILYATGIRVKELINLEVDDFLTDERLLFIRNGKGGKDRIIPLGENAYKFLIEYLSKYRNKLLKGKRIKYLFVSSRKRSFSSKELSVTIKKISRKVGLENKVSPHVIRHTFATHLLKRGAGIRQIQLLLGHKSLRSTQVYINLNKEHLKDIYEKYHPLENELYFDVYGNELSLMKGELKLGRSIVRVKKII